MMAAAEATLARELARLRSAPLRHAERRNLRDRAYRQRDAAVRALLEIPFMHVCAVCRATGYHAPHHSPGCALAAWQERLVVIHDA